MEKQLTAILLKATDVRESDRSARLFSAEEGVVTVKLRGVRKPNAKLKFAAQPFALCRYELSGRNGTLTVTGASPIEDLYGLSADPDKYAAGCVMLEIAEKAATSLVPSELFIVLLKALKALLYTPASVSVILAKFIQKVLSMSGFLTNPEKKESYPDTPGGLLDRMAYMSLNELPELCLGARTEIAALKRIAQRFCAVYECRLTSLDVLTSLIENT